jgi:hypothetical protein
MVDFSVTAKSVEVCSLINWTYILWSFLDLIYSELWTPVKESNLLLWRIFEFTNTEFRHSNRLMFYCRPPISLAYSGLWIHSSVYVFHNSCRNNVSHVIIWYLADCAVWYQILFVRHLIKATISPRNSIQDLIFKNRAFYIWDGRTATLQMLHFIYFFNNYEYFKHAAHSPFFSSKCRLCHNATFFGFCIIHTLLTGCAKI